MPATSRPVMPGADHGRQLAHQGERAVPAGCWPAPSCGCTRAAIRAPARSGTALATASRVQRSSAPARAIRTSGPMIRSSFQPPRQRATWNRTFASGSPASATIRSRRAGDSGQPWLRQPDRVLAEAGRVGLRTARRPCRHRALPNDSSSHAAWSRASGPLGRSGRDQEQRKTAFGSLRSEQQPLRRRPPPGVGMTQQEDKLPVDAPARWGRAGRGFPSATSGTIRQIRPLSLPTSRSARFLSSTGMNSGCSMTARAISTT